MVLARDFVFPQPCLGCGVEVAGGLCLGCLMEVPQIAAACERCGAPRQRIGAGGCRDCLDAKAFTRARQVFRFEGVVRRAVHLLKYGSCWSLAEPLGAVLAERMLPGSGVCVTWVPSAGRRRIAKGYDHAELLAHVCARAWRLPCVQLIERVRMNPLQVGLGRPERREAQASTMRARMPPPSDVVVIDDVFTTGATIDEAARALIQAGSSNVECICLARSPAPR